ncbi:MAG: transglycosylase domain-containing protein [Deltaproteobacteria bacterium]|nr:transglycosylase domain-containing protein [Deltaproteobacteria bacterium]
MRPRTIKNNNKGKRQKKHASLFRIIKITLCFSGAAFLFITAFIATVYFHILEDTANRIQKGAIRDVILSESPVFYDDGVTPVGVFFDQIHSQFIEYKDIPSIYVKAIVASEDGNFFDHPGFDIQSIARAFFANLKAGRVVQGGSTITQQTAKNVFKREKRNYTAKIKELAQALLLERRYTKEEILEMYVNQFFVTGFGKGLKIASEYFFDKNAEDLDLVESAFLAGMVKGPYLYNPFTLKSETERINAIRLSNIRKNYVLKNMMNLNFITEEEYLEAVEKEIPFKEGKITYRLNVIMDHVREQLESEYFRNILREQGVENIATSGIKIHTSVNHEIQQGALDSIRTQLPILDVKLTGYDTGIYQERYVRSIGTLHTEPTSGLPFFGRITEIDPDSNRPSLRVTWDDGEGVIDYEGIKPIAEAWLKGNLGSWASLDKRHASDFFKNFSVGDLVPIRQITEAEKTKLILSAIPELDGGIIVIRDGMVKAMVGGFFDRYFNRAVDAKRQLGSIFKPIVYTAALQLKWNNLDSLNNAYDMFEFENTFYFPNPDHQPGSEKTSMVWAGAKSENLATVWLLYHLTDHLNMNEFRQVVERLGLHRLSDESYSDYVERIRDSHGVVVNQNAIMEAAFEESKKAIESDLIFSGLDDVLDNLHRLHFNIDSQRLDPSNENHIQISRLSFQRLKALDFEMQRRFQKLSQFIETNPEKTYAEPNKELSDALQHFYLIKDRENNIRIIYSETAGKIKRNGLQPLTPELLEDHKDQMFQNDIWIDDLLTSKVVKTIQSSMNKRYKELLAYNRYDLELLFRIRDFKTLVNLYYVRQLAKEMGISSTLDPVLSFPLGASAVSILDAASAYHTIMTGRDYSVADSARDMVPIITRIVDRDNEIIWDYNPRPRQVLSKEISAPVTEILRMAMENGTGINARDAIHMSIKFSNQELDIRIPCFGKTGTANRYTNSSFVGFIPEPNKNTGEFELKNGYVIASYVGYDNNRPMKGKHITIYGSSGALPLWIETANAITNSTTYTKLVQAADLIFDSGNHPVLTDNKLSPVNVSPLTGIPLDRRAEVPVDSPQVYSYINKEKTGLKFQRTFDPIEGTYHDKQISD